MATDKYNIMEAARLAYDAYSAALHGEIEHKQADTEADESLSNRPRATAKSQRDKPSDNDPLVQKPSKDDPEPQHVLGDWANLDKQRRMRWVAAAKAAITHYVVTRELEPVDTED